MSRIGKLPISLPKGVEINVSQGNLVTVKGPKGQLIEQVSPDLKLNLDAGVLTVERPTDQKRHREAHGLYRSLIYNMVKGVTEPYTVDLELEGVGYRVTNAGNIIEMLLGFSHPIHFFIPNEIKVETFAEKGQRPTLRLTCIDKQLLGQVVAKIRSYRAPEPYKGKGIRKKDEIIRRKAGKTSGKGGGKAKK